MSEVNEAPTDKQASKAWDQIMRIAKKHALVVQAYGGVATLVIPEEQRSAGCRRAVLCAHQMDETKAN